MKVIAILLFVNILFGYLSNFLPLRGWVVLELQKEGITMYRELKSAQK